ncbi:hypothetical protein [Chthonomonas calidirosea]|uniref:hypothetical protein n=1 Tax=Chthonomonas calidirosea TaxID=454171 RepID=UPI0006ECAF67|nr:hypothetical protein [Chthonomonas calidirosea]CEK13973.1 hypothetical protein CP488_00682 [Chthonomonas calidirosea]
MQRSSWIALGLSVLLIAILTVSYFVSQARPKPFDATQAQQILHDLQVAVRQKDVEGIMQYVAPNARLIGDMDTQKARLLLARAFRTMQNPEPSVSDVQFHADADEPSVSFDLNLRDQGPDYTSDEYEGRITLYFRQVTITHLFGLYHTVEWRIVHAETTGPNPDNFGDF